MSDSDRLAELRKQRALVQEHLAWLDAEIAAEAKRAGPAAPLNAPLASAPSAPFDSPPPPSSKPSVPDSVRADEIESHADAVMDEYRVAPIDLQRDVRRGCLIYFVTALVLLGAVVVGMYFALRR